MSKKRKGGDGGPTSGKTAGFPELATKPMQHADAMLGGPQRRPSPTSGKSSGNMIGRRTVAGLAIMPGWLLLSGG